MCAKLLILESPGKVKKVQEILGPGWKVAASVGHVRDLPVKEMGVAAPDFKPQNIPTDRGKDVLSRLAGMVKNAEEVFLATDPDREGERAKGLTDFDDLNQSRGLGEVKRQGGLVLQKEIGQEKSHSQGRELSL